jgi:hypothetical protein
MQASVDTLQQKLLPCGENAGISLVNFDHCADALGSSACSTADVSYFNATSTCFDTVKDCAPNQEDAWQAAVNECQTHLAPVSKSCRAALDPGSSGS